MKEFAFHFPTSVAEAVTALEKAEDGKLLAGGQSLIPLMKLGLSEPSDLVVLSNIQELRGIRVEGGELRVGGASPHAEVQASAEVGRAVPALARLAGGIGDPQVRNRGTLGGATAHADPAADYPAALLALAATVETDRRSIAADDFFAGLFETALAADEIVTAVRFPIPERAAYAKFPNPASKFAIVGVMVAKGPAGVRVAVTGAASSVFRVPDMEKALAAEFTERALQGAEHPSDDLMSDLDASAEYRAHLIGVMARRAVRACA